MKVGQRRLNMLRAFNAREGFSRKDDKLPKKFYKALQGTGPTAGVAIDPAELEAALDLYYHLLAWTPDGIPTRTALSDLGIEWVAEKVGV
jgi:aldehyde:ferredoxin oxidoreductase